MHNKTPVRDRNHLHLSASIVGALVACSAATLAIGAEADDTRAAPLVRFDVRSIVESGQPAPGAAGGFFEHFGAAEGFGFDSAPQRIDRTGAVHFTALLGTDGDPDTIDGQFPEVFRVVDGVVEAVARIGDPAPGVPNGTFTSFPSFFGQLPGAHAGRTTFIGSTDSAITFGLWSDRFGALAPVLLPDEHMPDTPPGTGVFQFAFTTRGNAVVINALFSTAFADEGLWINPNGSWQTIAARGVPAPGTEPGVVFDAGTSLAFFGPVDRWDVNENGVAIFNGYLGGPGIHELNDEGIWAGRAGALRLLAREGEAAPGQGPNVVWGPGTGLQAFADDDGHVAPTLNDRGTVVFGATLRGPGFDHLEGTFLKRLNGPLETIATAASGLPGSPTGSPAPGLPNHTFATFNGASLNERNSLAIIATATDSDPLGDVRVGIWSTHRGGGLRMIAAGNEPVPGVPGATFNNTFAGGIQLATLSDDDILYFLGSFGQTTAVFASPRRGATVMVVREGRPLDLHGDGTDIRIPAQISLGAAHADDGSRSIEVGFTDGSSAIVVATPR
jgi:hypothetical protein